VAARRTSKRRWEYGDPNVVTLLLDPEELLGYLDNEVESQMAFATSLAVNLTAKDATSDLKRRLPGSFIIRNRWTERGIVMEPSSKRQPDIVAKVGSTRLYMRLQALGGYREPAKSGTPHVAVPKGARPTKAAKTTPAKFPAQIVLRAEKRRWSPAGRSGGRVFKGGKKRKNQRLVLMYSMHSRARVQKVWDFARQVDRAVQRTFEKHAKDALHRSLKTAKRKTRKRR